MNKYQIVIIRKLKGFGQFVTESREEVNLYEFGPDDERPVIFGEKLKAVERRTIMRKVREVLAVNCWLTTAKKNSDAGISGLCLSCPACALFGGTYAPKKGGTGSKNAIEMRRVYYTGAFPFRGGGIRDITFNAVDERTGQTGTALNTNQVIEPRDFVDVVTVEGDDEKWVKLLVWGIVHSDRYGANTRIYGEVHNEVIGVLVDTRLRLAAIDLCRLSSAQDVRNTFSAPVATSGDATQTTSDAANSVRPSQTDQLKTFALKQITCSDDEINQIIRDLANSEPVQDVARRKNSVDVSVDEYFHKTLESLKLTLPVEEKTGKPKKLSVADRVALLMNGLPGKTHYDLARQIERVNFAEVEAVDDEESLKP